MAYGARLESVLGASPRGFESPILRQIENSALTRTFPSPSGHHRVLRGFVMSPGRNLRRQQADVELAVVMFRSSQRSARVLRRVSSRWPWTFDPLAG